MQEMGEIEYRPWDGLEYTPFDFEGDEGSGGIYPFLRTVGPGVDAGLLDADFDESDATVRLCWGLRRQLWRELIHDGRISVEFTHDSAAGSGSGPNVVLGSPSAQQSRLILRADFPMSDMMYTQGGLDPDLWGWTEFVPRNESWIDVEVEGVERMWEYTFDSRDVLDVDVDVARQLPSWSDVVPTGQQNLVSTLLGRLVPVEAETTANVSGEEIFDLLVMITEAPGTADVVFSVLAEHPNVWVRRALAFGSATPKGILVHLATDEDVVVRAGVTSNPSAPKSVKDLASMPRR